MTVAMVKSACTLFLVNLTLLFLSSQSRRSARPRADVSSHNTAVNQSTEESEFQTTVSKGCFYRNFVYSYNATESHKFKNFLDVFIFIAKFHFAKVNSVFYHVYTVSCLRQVFLRFFVDALTIVAK